MKTHPALLMALLIALVSAAVTCSSNSPPREQGPGGGDKSVKDSVPAADRAVVDASRTPDQSAAPDKAFVPLDYGTVASCSDVGFAKCFSNYECAADRRCQNLASEELPVSCCVPGPRGSKNPGETCSGQLDCASGICIEKWGGTEPPLCSKTCTTVDDCPTKMKKCVVMVQSGTNDKWCFPE
jgi:hypothetical protein